MLALALAGCGTDGGYRSAPTDNAPPPSADPLPPASRALPPDAPQGVGPRGTSGDVPEDVVGYAAPMTGPGDARFANVAIGVVHPSLPPGGFVEVTSLDTGRTLVAMIVASSGGGSVLALSPGAVQALGVGDHAAVRVRTIVVSPQDRVALRSGRAASPRLDAPPALIAALRRKLPVPSARDRGQAPRSTPPRISVPRGGAPAVSARPAAGSGFFVQVAALSSADRATALARRLGGHVAATGALYRIQLGPYTDMASARRARDDVARLGYGDARVFHTE